MDGTSGDYENELRASFYHSWCPRGGGIFLPSHDKMRDTQVSVLFRKSIFDFNCLCKKKERSHENSQVAFGYTGPVVPVVEQSSGPVVPAAERAEEAGMRRRQRRENSDEVLIYILLLLQKYKH